MQIGIAIVKSTLFRGVQQEFTNVYHYSDPTNAGPDYGGLANEVVALEKSFHSTAVNFKRVSVWTSGGTPQQNQMQYQADLTGTGSTPLMSDLDRERAILIQWPAGLSTTGKPVFLRKWYHPCGQPSSTVNFSAGVKANTEKIAQADCDALANILNGVRIIGAADQWLLCAASGRLHSGPGVVHEYLEHHQLGDQWR